MGIVECVNHNLLEPFNVLYEKDGKAEMDCSPRCARICKTRHSAREK